MIPADTPVPLALLLAGVFTTVMVALRYFVTSGLFAFATARLRPELYVGRGAQIGREIRWSLISAAIYGVPAGGALWLFHHRGLTEIYTDWSALPLWYLPVSVVIYLAVQDTWFYWTHRAMHHPRLFRRFHAVHHEGRTPTAWTSMSFHPLEAITGAIVIPVLVFLVPIHVALLGLVLTIATVMGVINHLGWEILPRRLVHSALGHWVITASHHERHHEGYRCNFGLYFRFWDHLCGTDRGFSPKLDRQAQAHARPKAA
ncbi:MAG: sterol desaturase family protein [Erythrobacter sp.]